MFGLFKKRNRLPSAEELSRQSQMAIEDVKEKWLHFLNTVNLVDKTPLSQKIDFFAQPLTQYFQKKYSELLLGGSKIFWMTIFTSILESGTHSKDEVNAAISELRNKYGGMK